MNLDKYKKRRVVSFDYDGETIHVRSMSGFDRDSHSTFILKRNNGGKVTNPAGIREHAVALSLCDADGKPVFDDKEKAVAELSECSVSFIDAVYEQVDKLNKLSDEQVKETAKN